MQDYIVKGVVLKAIDLKEKDKLLTIYTLERGIISANLRGVRQQKSKLKFAAQPLCFAEFSLVGNGDILTCTNASEIESFFAVTSNYDALVLAGAICEMIYLTAIKESNVDLFVALVRALGGLCDETINPDVVFIKFCLQFFKCMGYKLNLDTCKNCGNVFNDDCYLDLNSGAIVCKDCTILNSIIISKQCFKLLNMIDNLQFTNLSSIKLDTEQSTQIKHILVKNFNALFDKNLKSIKIKT